MLPNVYSQFIHASRYARWSDTLSRRETWEETVDRYISFFSVRNTTIDSPTQSALRSAILNLEVMPSMRAMMAAGEALNRDNVAGFNCSYVAVDHPRVFDEIMYILMCGTGVGFSVERRSVEQLPAVAEEMHKTDTTIVFADSKIGWASGYRELIALLYSGKIPKFDFHKIRPAGAKLKTFGGRASGPGPLEDLCKFTINTFSKAAGRKLNSLEVHDLVCKIADIVVVGGVRRSALISLSNLTDERMAKAKSGKWWEANPQRALANNSVCYTERPDIGIFMKEWLNLYESKSGERGIFNREAAKAVAGRSGRRDPNFDFGTNPCSEIILRSGQFCNLTEVVVRPTDTLGDLKQKVRIATILGTLQATLTDFRYLRPIWKRNTEEEALLGVSLTGIMDHPVLNGTDTGDINTPIHDWYLNFLSGDYSYLVSLPSILLDLKEVAIETNKEWATKLGINPSAAITCVKPSGTVSQLVDSASGIHARHAPYYIRRVRGDVKDPISKFMIDQGVPYEVDVMKPDSHYVFSFPMKAPEGAVTRHERSALEQLELWKVYAEHWCEHKPSITVNVKEKEWLEVGSWCYKNIDILSGVSFLPDDEHIYKQAPYEDITKEQYDKMLKTVPTHIDWSLLKETEDNTTNTKDLACSAGFCEVI